MAIQCCVPEHIIFPHTTLQIRGRFHKELGLVLSRVRPSNSSYLGLILRSACYSAGLGLVLSPNINLKFRKSLVKSTAGYWGPLQVLQHGIQ